MSSISSLSCISAIRSQPTSSKIAIVVPVYNVEKYVAACLQSILDQRYQDWECFVVDDGATDGSGAIIDQFALLDERFRVFHKNNGGVSSARNFALDIIEKEKLRFNFVFFVDSDDTVEPDIYTELTDAIKSDNSDIAICPMYRFYTDGKRIEGKIPPRKVINREEYVELIFGFGEWANINGAGGGPYKLFRTETIFGIRFINSKEAIEDEFFCLEAGAKAAKISVLPTPLYVYRQRLGSCVHDNKFLFRHLKGREFCLHLATRISDHAHFVVVTAYLPLLVHCVKLDTSFNGISNKVIAPDVLNKFLGSSICPKKVRFQYRIFAEHPLISKIYLRMRAVFRAFFNKKKKVSKQTNLFQ